MQHLKPGKNGQKCHGNIEFQFFLKIADLLAGPWRSTINAATMLGQSKTVYQAEIDSAAELIDFYRFNSYYMAQLMQDQPYSGAGMWNRLEYRA
jgi:1-pyrroline-5-carboxylate dehydrogenase